MKTNDVKTGEPFQTLFRIKEENYKEVLEDMKQNGYDPNEVVSIWKEENILIDGYTRLKAAKELGIEEIPASFLTFEDEEQAIEHSIRHNSKRRAVTAGDKFRCVELLDEVKERGGDHKSKDFQKSKTKNLVFENNEVTAKHTAKLIGISDLQVNKMRTILGYCDQEDIDDVKNDELSIDKAWKEAKKIKDKIESDRKNDSQFNRTNESIDWAKWTWNPITGCKHECKYCYARDIAKRFYKQGFEPTFHEKRLKAPKNTKIPEEEKDIEGIHNVFLVSMGDMLGDWVPDEWIEKILDPVDENHSWNYIILTKNPDKYLEFEWPKNCLLGVTTDTQKRLNKAIEIFSKMEGENIKFVSCEPLKTEIKIPKNSNIDWVIIGGQSRTSKVPEYQPQWEWIESLMCQCKNFNIPYYWKPNLETRPKMYPKNLKL